MGREKFAVNFDQYDYRSASRLRGTLGRVRSWPDRRCLHPASTFMFLILDRNVMPEYRLILRRSSDDHSEIIDLIADDLRMVLAFASRQRSLLKPPLEIWHDGNLLMTLWEP